MCGIFGYIGKKNQAFQIVFEGLRELEYRGYDSWGIAGQKEGNSIFLKKGVGPLPKRAPSFVPSSFAFGHTRWATHGKASRLNAHPHFDCQKEIFVIHNGIIENFEKLKENLKRRGHNFISQTDSEIVAHIVEEELKTKTGDSKNKEIKAVKNAFGELEGLNAIIVSFPKRNLFVLAKNLSPIVIGKKNGDFYFASDPNALSLFTKDIFYLEDGEIAKIDKNDVFVYQLKSLRKRPYRFLRYSPPAYSEKKQKFPHFMIKEIFEEPASLFRLLKNSEQIAHLASKIQKSFGTYLIGSGSAGFAAIFGTYILSQVAHRHVNFSFASEFSYLVDFLTKKSLVVTFSQSGETADVIFSVRKAKEKGAKIAAVTNVFGSTLYRLADLKVLLEAGPEKCVVATKSLSNKLAVIILLSCILSGRYQEGEKTIKEAAGKLDKMQNETLLRKIKSIVKKFSKKEHLFVIGRGASYPLALEGALKIKEGSYLHAEAFAGAELKHGVIALIEKGTPCIVIAPSDETYGDILSNAMEIKARGGHIIGICSKKSTVFDDFIQVEDLGLGTYLLIAFVLQLFGYYCAILRGLNPDRPRNLAKSVTVK